MVTALSTWVTLKSRKVLVLSILSSLVALRVTLMGILAVRLTSPTQALTEMLWTESCTADGWSDT